MRFKVKYRLVYEGTIEVAADNDLEASDKVEWMGGSELFNNGVELEDTLIEDVTPIQD